ncbi:MAG: YezD family protein [Ignavibacteriaceae bacterium]|jgi:hypothetical protein
MGHKEAAHIPIEEIIKSIKSIKFGQVQITIHNYEVVQIDKIEKVRFEKKDSNQKSVISSNTKT